MGNLITGFLFDAYSLFFAPSAVLLGILAGLAYRRGLLHGKRKILGILMICFLPSLVSSFIAAGLFGGITSSGSSFVARWLHPQGMNLVLSVLVTQVLTDFIDKAITSQLGLYLSQRIQKVKKG